MYRTVPLAGIEPAGGVQPNGSGGGGGTSPLRRVTSPALSPRAAFVTLLMFRARVSSGSSVVSPFTATRMTAPSAPLVIFPLPVWAGASDGTLPVPETSVQVNGTSFFAAWSRVAEMATVWVPASGSRTVTSPTLRPTLGGRMVTLPVASARVAPVARVSSTVNASTPSVTLSALMARTIVPPWAPAGIVMVFAALTKSATEAVPATVRQSTLTAVALAGVTVTGSSNATSPVRAVGS